jgi:hypothetical protein
MDPLLKKLNFKNQAVIHVLNAPDSFADQLATFAQYAQVNTDPAKLAEIEFVMTFATKQIEVDNAIRLIAPLLKGDALLWICYPKGTSKRYKCEFHRDTGWKVVGEHGFETVRLVAIDEDWSAMRFRHAKYIKAITRNFPAISAEGRIKAGQAEPGGE